MLVTDHGKPVTDLRETDFEVFDNGVLQQIEFLGFQQTPIDAILVLDMSASVAGEALENLKNAGHQFLAALKKDEQAALVTFSDVITLRSPLSNDIGRMHDALIQTNPIGDTSLMDACYAGLMLQNQNPAGRCLWYSATGSILSAGCQTKWSWRSRNAAMWLLMPYRKPIAGPNVSS